jgi:hypothetical protein
VNPQHHPNAETAGPRSAAGFPVRDCDPTKVTADREKSRPNDALACNCQRMTTHNEDPDLQLILQIDRETEPPPSSTEQWLTDEIRRAPTNSDYRVWLIEILCRIHFQQSRWT